MWRLRQARPQSAALRFAEFATIRPRLITVAARAVENVTGTSQRFPDVALCRHDAVSLRTASPYRAADQAQPGKPAGIPKSGRSPRHRKLQTAATAKSQARRSEAKPDDT